MIVYVVHAGANYYPSDNNIRGVFRNFEDANDCKQLRDNSSQDWCFISEEQVK